MITKENIEEFNNVGVTSFRALNEQVAERMGRRASYVDHMVHNTVITETGDHCNYLLADYRNTIKRLPELDSLYDIFFSELKRLGIDVVKSPWERPKININAIYDGFGRVGNHRDSNPITVLLGLSYGAPTIVCTKEKEIKLSTRPGIAHILRGKEYLHYVPDRHIGGIPVRITVPFNYYTTDDCDRPSWWDAHVYGKQDYIANA